MSVNEAAVGSTMIAGLSDTLQRALNISAVSAEVLVSLLIFCVTGLICGSLYVVISKYVTNWAKKTPTTLDDKLVDVIKVAMLIIMGILVIEFSLSPLSFLEPYAIVLDKLFTMLQFSLAAYAVAKTANAIIDWYTDKPMQEGRQNSKHLLAMLKKIATMIVAIATFILILNLFELDGLTMTALSSLGVASIAVAFALQNTLSDFFSAFSIYFDRPFEIGDFIVVGEHSGTVKKISMRSTRIQLLQGEELIVSNKELTSTYVRNFKKLEKRRVVFNISVTYDTPNEKLKKIPSIIVNIVKSIKEATPQFVTFNEFGEYSLKFFISYFVNTPDYGKYLEVQQEINLAIKEAFEHEDIEMAYLKNVTYIKR